MKYLEKIKDERLKRAVLKAYKIYGYKLHFLPSSLTGHHHPVDERGINGLTTHIEKMCWFLDGVADEFKYSDTVRDMLLTAAYFHDIGKVKQTTVSHELTYESDGSSKRTTKVIRNIGGLDLHPIISAKMAREFLEKEGVEEEMIQTICDLIARHMSHWYPNLPRPQTELEKMFALADFIVSREDFKIEKEEGRWARLKRRLS